MNENWNDLESPLASWTPRRPSPKLKENLFPSTASAAPAASWLFRQNWWMPATVGMLLLLVSLNDRGGWSSRSAAAHGFVAPTGFSNQSDIAYLAADSVQHNTATIFKWTSDAGYRSSINFFRVGPTNNLLH